MRLSSRVITSNVPLRTLHHSTRSPSYAAHSRPAPRLRRPLHRRMVQPESSTRRGVLRAVHLPSAAPLSLPRRNPSWPISPISASRWTISTQTPAASNFTGPLPAPIPLPAAPAAKSASAASNPGSSPPITSSPNPSAPSTPPTIAANSTPPDSPPQKKAAAAASNLTLPASCALRFHCFTLFSVPFATHRRHRFFTSFPHPNSPPA
jgi:hypothetical protein